MSLENSVVPGDARALQLRLYREMGVAAVAAALELPPSPEGSIETLPKAHTPAIVARDKPQDLAA